MTDKNDFMALLDKKKEIEDLIKVEAKDVFANASKEVFEKYGDKVGAFGWSQYTPYFNDGDPCVFAKNELYIHTPEDAESGEYGPWDSSEPYSTYGNKAIFKTLYRRKSDPSYTISWSWAADSDQYEAFENPDYDPEYGEPYSMIVSLYEMIDSDTALSLFGDHVQIKVTADGVEATEYDHD